MRGAVSKSEGENQAVSRYYKNYSKNESCPMRERFASVSSLPRTALSKQRTVGERSTSSTHSLEKP